MTSLRRLSLACLTVACIAALPSAAGAATPKTKWLCKPGLQDNPCLFSLSTTRVSPTGETLGVDNVKNARDPKIDCFYVYPTTSDQDGPQADLSIDPELVSIARYQAARYSRECRVFAPVYRQITIAGLLAPDTVTSAMRTTAYKDVRTAWRTYLRKYNRGRGVVFISHSQGTRVLRRLLTEEIDPKPTARRLLVSALLMGGNVLVKQGRDVGGDFKRIRACRSQSQIGCVVAFSTFNDSVPSDSRFGRTPEKRREVLCTNPASLAGGSGRLDPIFPNKPFAPGTVIGALTTQIGFTAPTVSTAWIASPGAYKASCSSAAGAHVLQIKSVSGAPKLAALPDPTWGLHLADANIGLGNLTDLVRRQAEVYSAG